jgi:hypothetical protein
MEGRPGERDGRLYFMAPLMEGESNRGVKGGRNGRSDDP